MVPEKTKSDASRRVEANYGWNRAEVVGFGYIDTSRDRWCRFGWLVEMCFGLCHESKVFGIQLS
jgi:hypothetical protein